jgi:ribosomal 50S subunit-recycling heat shock protein
VDVFLKQSRLVKRRTLAKELCDEGCVLVNGQPARAGRDVEAGDEITLKLRNRSLSVEVTEVPEEGSKGAPALYRVLRDERKSDFEAEDGR